MTSTTKGRPAATGRPLKPESGGNRSQTDAAPTKGYDMFTQQSSYATAELRSTTDTAPIKFQRTDRDGVLIQLEDGSTQLYDRRDLLIAALGTWEDDGITSATTVMVVGRALTGRPSDLFGEELRVTWTGGAADPRLDG